MIHAKRAVLLICTLVVGSTLLIGALVGALHDSGRKAPSSRTGGYDTTGVMKSIGDEVQESSLIVNGVVEGVEKPVWNSPDGSDWSDQWSEAPNKYEVPAVAFVPVDVKIQDVYLKNDSSISEDPAPSMSVGDSLIVLFERGALNVGDKRVFFVSWTPETLSDGSSKSVWYCDEQQGVWSLDGDYFIPPVPWQSYSLVGAKESGVDGISVDSNGGRIEVAAFTFLAQDEAKTADVDVMGFEQWPWEEAYAAASSKGLATPGPSLVDAQAGQPSESSSSSLPVDPSMSQSPSG